MHTENAQRFIGRAFPYERDEETCAFVIDQWRVALMQWLVPISFRGEHWLRVADIVWKPGVFSFLYFNGNNRFIAVDDVILHGNSVVRREYEA